MIPCLRIMLLEQKLTKSLNLFVEHFTPSLYNQSLVTDQFLSKTPTELRYLKRLFYRKDVS